jgi:hypothetical protein
MKNFDQMRGHVVFGLGLAILMLSILFAWNTDAQLRRLVREDRESLSQFAKERITQVTRIAKLISLCLGCTAGVYAVAITWLFRFQVSTRALIWYVLSALFVLVCGIAPLLA